MMRTFLPRYRSMSQPVAEHRNPATRATILLKKGRAKPLWFGHPWIYSDAVASMRGAAEPGDVVAVCDEQERFIGLGFWNPRSQIRVRMCTLAADSAQSLREDSGVVHTVDGAWVRHRIEQAVDLRRRLGLPSAETTAYRLVNSEGDGLPGLVVDVYGSTVSVQFSALGMKRLEGAVFDALRATVAPTTIFETSAGGFASVEGFVSEPRVAWGEPVIDVWCREDGVELCISPLQGQKTGAYLDQREHHALVGRLAAGAKMLDCYTYLGGFALAALRGGAASAVAVDSSARALERTLRNAERAQVADRLQLVENDVFRYLEAAPARRFDLLVVDPPKFAKARKDLDAALKGYRRLNALAMNAAAEGALLATCSCSGLVTEELFERAIAAAAKDARRRVTLLHVGAQPADHPVLPSFAEGRYLKLLLCRVE
jgi:23S rRNA (cytosine1962-C5)-methyltransferase